MNTNQFFAPLIEQFERAFAEAFIHERFRDLYSVADTPQAALEAIEAVTPAE